MTSFLKKENLSKFISKELNFVKKILRTKQGIFILIVLAIIALPVTNNIIQGKQAFNFSRTTAACNDKGERLDTVVIEPATCIDSKHYIRKNGNIGSTCPMVETTIDGKEVTIQSTCRQTSTTGKNATQLGIDCVVKDDACKQQTPASQLKESDCRPGQCDSTLNGAYLGVSEPHLEPGPCQNKCLNYPDQKCDGWVIIPGSVRMCALKKSVEGEQFSIIKNSHSVNYIAGIVPKGNLGKGLKEVEVGDPVKDNPPCSPITDPLECNNKPGCFYHKASSGEGGCVSGNKDESCGAGNYCYANTETCIELPDQGNKTACVRLKSQGPTKFCQDIDTKPNNNACQSGYCDPSTLKCAVNPSGNTATPTPKSSTPIDACAAFYGSNYNGATMGCGNYHGGDIDSIKGSNPKACQSVCQNRADCKAWTYFKPTDTCWIKGAGHAGLTSCTGADCASGAKGSWTPPPNNNPPAATPIPTSAADNCSSPSQKYCGGKCWGVSTAQCPAGYVCNSEGVPVCSSNNSNPPAACGCPNGDIKGQAYPFTGNCGQTYCGTDNRFYKCTSPGGHSGWQLQAGEC